MSKTREQFEKETGWKFVGYGLATTPKGFKRSAAVYYKAYSKWLESQHIELLEAFDEQELKLSFNKEFDLDLDNPPKKVAERCDMYRYYSNYLLAKLKTSQGEEKLLGFIRRCNNIFNRLPMPTEQEVKELGSKAQSLIDSYPEPKVTSEIEVINPRTKEVLIVDRDKATITYKDSDIDELD